MSTEQMRNYIPWREREFVTVSEAAQILGKSSSAIREMISEGELQALRLRKNSPMVVSAGSLLLLAQRAETVKSPRIRETRHSGRPKLTLIHCRP